MHCKELCITYARILIEIDVTQNLKEQICIKDHLGRKFHRVIEYEWQPLYCATCLQPGHDCSLKKHPPKPKSFPHNKAWKPLPQQPVVAREPDVVRQPPVPIKTVVSDSWTVVGLG